MGRKQPGTPRSRVRAALRLLFMRSRERAAALKRDNNTCQVCGKKKSVAKGKEVKVECHHVELIDNWQYVIDAVFRHILTDPKNLITLCQDCHHEAHEKGEL